MALLERAVLLERERVDRAHQAEVALELRARGRRASSRRERRGAGASSAAAGSTSNSVRRPLDRGLELQPGLGVVDLGALHAARVPRRAPLESAALRRAARRAAPPTHAQPRPDGAGARAAGRGGLRPRRGDRRGARERGVGGVALEEVETVLFRSAPAPRGRATRAAPRPPRGAAAMHRAPFLERRAPDFRRAAAPERGAGRLDGALGLDRVRPRPSPHAAAPRRARARVVAAPACAFATDAPRTRRRRGGRPAGVTATSSGCASTRSSAVRQPSTSTVCASSRASTACRPGRASGPARPAGAHRAVRARLRRRRSGARRTDEQRARARRRPRAARPCAGRAHRRSTTTARIASPSADATAASAPGSISR